MFAFRAAERQFYNDLQCIILYVYYNMYKGTFVASAVEGRGIVTRAFVYNNNNNFNFNLYTSATPNMYKTRIYRFSESR